MCVCACVCVCMRVEWICLRIFLFIKNNIINKFRYCLVNKIKIDQIEEIKNRIILVSA